MNVTRASVTIVTDASGDGVGYTEDLQPGGLLSQIRYVKTDYADGVDFVITEEDTGINLLTEASVNASATRAPRQAVHGAEDGAVATFAAGGTSVRDMFAVRGRLKIVVAQGGNAKTGTFHFSLI